LQNKQTQLSKILAQEKQARGSSRLFFFICKVNLPFRPDLWTDFARLYYS
jgi:hypothetical protein